ncbi:MAG: 30S ribosomal protein S12 methylthiotransferase RimO [Caldisericaceae bacterium]
MKRERVSIVSLGCPKNLVDSERILGIFNKNGFTVTFDADESDIVVINTCAFLQSAREESLDVIGEFASKKNKGLIKKIVVAGCYPSLDGKALKERFPEIDAIIGTNNIGDVVDAVKKGKIDISRKYEPFMYQRVKATLPHYEYLKIADGCNHRCAFCIIPKIKGHTHSFLKESIINESKALVESGVKELIVIAQDITQYGIDLYKKNELLSLLGAIDKIEGISWIRLMYTYPSLSMLDLIDFMVDSEHIVPYIDIPIQHISDRILKLMRRATNRKDIETIFTKLKNNGIAIRTSVIVGFPHETEADFNELKGFLADYQVDHLGIFEYSNEEKSVSYKMTEQVSPEDKSRRFEELSQVRDLNAFKRSQSLLGKTVDTIVDYFDESAKKFVGRTIFDAPEIDDIVYFMGTQTSGEILKSKIVNAKPYEYVAKRIKESRR